MDIIRNLKLPDLSQIEEIRNADMLKSAGWLPHLSIPAGVCQGALDKSMDVSTAVECYLRDNWDSVAAVFRERFRAVGADEEALAAMDEALECRGRGLHRAVSRIVFPEIERVVRLRVPPPKPDQMAGLGEFRKSIGEVALSSPFDASAFIWLEIYDEIQNVCYAKVGLDRGEDDFRFPNRHAVAHGRFPYSSPRDSMNSLVLADFMLTCVQTLEAELSARKGGDEAE